MAEPKTTRTNASVSDFLASIADENKRKDARALVRLMRRVTGEKPAMWGSSIIGFGQLRYRSPATGREGNWPVLGFSPRAANLTLYFMAGFKRLGPLLKKLGKHSTGSSCLYIKRLSEVDDGVLEELVEQGLREAKTLDRSGEPPKSATKAPRANERRPGRKPTTVPSGHRTTRTRSEDQKGAKRGATRRTR
jgi:hypothetical protein